MGVARMRPPVGPPLLVYDGKKVSHHCPRAMVEKIFMREREGEGERGTQREDIKLLSQSCLLLTLFCMTVGSLFGFYMFC